MCLIHTATIHLAWLHATRHSEHGVRHDGSLLRCRNCTDQPTGRARPSLQQA